MPKKKINHGEAYTAHYNRIERYIALVEAIFEQATKDSVRLARSVKYDGKSLFAFRDYPKVKARFEELINAMADDIQAIVVNGVTAEWEESNFKNDKLARSILGERLAVKSKYKRFFQNNESALKAFLTRKDSGMNLSSRVWNLTQKYKSDLELALSIGLADGKSAAELSRDIREFLNEPERLFRRVRNKYGDLVLSKAAKSYHPGEGIYRSSYKNALRLARTEINMAYRTADHTRWQQLDFIVGFEVKRSGRDYS